MLVLWNSLLIQVPNETPDEDIKPLMSSKLPAMLRKLTAIARY